jgi:hypothetical protein
MRKNGDGVTFHKFLKSAVVVLIHSGQKVILQLRDRTGETNFFFFFVYSLQTKSGTPAATLSKGS